MKEEKRDNKKMQITIQTKLGKKGTLYLDKAGEYIAELRGMLLKSLQEGKNLNELKKLFLSQYGILARQFNSLHSEVKGMMKSVEALRKRNLKDAERRKKTLKHQIRKTKKHLKKMLKVVVNEEKKEREKCSVIIHQKNRKLRNIENKISKLKSRGICLGSRKLFLKQFHLEENGYENHAEWLHHFRERRTNRIFFIGSKDERFGNQNCQLLGGTLKVRVIPALSNEFSNYIDIPVKFSYQTELLPFAIANKQAINYRFVRKNNHWYLFVTTKRPDVKKITKKQLGAIGVDLNHSHVALAETNRHGNLINHGKIHTPTQDRTSNQVTATLAEASKIIVLHAKKQQKPIVIEKLDFTKKKSELAAQSIFYRRMISSFAYNKFAALLSSQAQRHGVEIIVVNPAFSSIIGQYKFASFFGISTHAAASLVLARRAFHFSERLPARTARCLPVDSHCHVWNFWKAFSKTAIPDRENLVELTFCSRHSPL